jgi:predicted AlkP superfamily pyrophosphatase or phosphodiesterase
MPNTRLLLCSMDGVRPDAIHRSRTPVLDSLANRGAYTWSARTVMPCCTLPCHTSMFRGVPPERHGITTNTFTPLVRPVPSIVDAASDEGLTTGAFYNWEQLRDLAAPGKLSVSVMVEDCHSAEGDRHIAAMASRYLENMDFDLLFLYLGWPDECAHRHGWMSDPYLSAIENADACLGMVLDTLARLGRLEDTAVLALSDHGGHERTHGTDCDEDMTIPWLLQGPGVREGHRLEAPVRIDDTCVTAARVLGLRRAPQWEGRVVEEAFAAVPGGPGGSGR